jgi:hypothetical protein
MRVSGGVSFKLWEQQSAQGTIELELALRGFTQWQTASTGIAVQFEPKLKTPFLGDSVKFSPAIRRRPIIIPIIGRRRDDANWIEDIIEKN